MSGMTLNVTVAYPFRHDRERVTLALRGALDVLLGGTSRAPAVPQVAPNM